MPDMEKTIKGLTDIGIWIAGRVGFKQARNFLHTIDDAVAVLKQQEPKPMFEVEEDDLYAWSAEDVSYYCPRPECGKEISYNYKFCPYCGQAVKWE